MHLYHVTLDLHHRGVFTPRVPENIEDYGDEEAETPRICFAPTLEGCLSSFPIGVYNLKEQLEDTDNIIKVFRLTLPHPQVAPKNIYTPQYLTQMGYVSDSWATGEHWLLKPITFTAQEVAFLKILSFDTACIGKTGLKPASKYQSGDVDCIMNLRYQTL